MDIRRPRHRSRLLVNKLTQYANKTRQILSQKVRDLYREGHLKGQNEIIFILSFFIS